MKYEMSEAAAAFAMLGAVFSIGVWILGLFYSGTILDNLFNHGWLLVLGGILYFISSTAPSPSTSKS
jgi:predicted phage tail protein